MSLSGKVGADSNDSLVEYLIDFGAIDSSKVVEVMKKIDRGLFVPQGFYNPYIDAPVPLIYNRTISEPHKHATVLSMYTDHLRPGSHAMVIGSGTGYMAACFSVMAGPEGRVVGVERIPELLEMSIENVKRSNAAHLLESGSLSFHLGDGRDGYPEFAPYDAIYVASATIETPQRVVKQLKSGRRMIVALTNYNRDLHVIRKVTEHHLEDRIEPSVRYRPIIREFWLNSH